MYAKDHGLEFLLTKATSSPAITTTPAWAGTLAHDVIRSDLIQKITAISAAAALMTQGMKMDLTGLASVTIPGRPFDPTGAAAGAWIAEGFPIPMRQPAISQGPKLTPHKLGVLSTFSQEMVMADHIEEFVTAAIRKSAATLLDLQMFSTNPGDAVHPPGILIGATSVTPSAATEAYAISRDVGLLVEALATNGAGMEPVLIASPGQAASLRLWRQADYYPILASLALPAGTVVAVEASSFVSGQDGLPEFSTSTGATLHFEDTAPADIVSGGVAAAPTKNLFQTDLIGLKMILRASWAMRNAKHVAIVSGVSW